MRIPFLRTKPEAPSQHPVLTDTVEPGNVRDARTRARQRLTGALVLLVLGVVLFPLLFETQPRPLAVDTPIVVAPVLAPRDASPAAPAVVVAAAAVPAPGPAVSASAALPATLVEQAPSRPASAQPVREIVEPVPQSSPAVVVPAPAAAAAPADPARFVVQAGAYGEAAALREARQKVEKLGLKTFIQVIDNGSGKRTRLRVGPFGTRQEAEGVAAKVKAAGLQANVLAL